MMSILGIDCSTGEIVITHRDRLSRFGFELLESLIFKCSHGKIVVLHHQEISPPQELINNDLLSIVTVFSSKVGMDLWTSNQLDQTKKKNSLKTLKG